MNGLLHRLAERAVGASVLLRPDTRPSIGDDGMGESAASADAARPEASPSRSMPAIRASTTSPPGSDRPAAEDATAPLPIPVPAAMRRVVDTDGNGVRADGRGMPTSAVLPAEGTTGADEAAGSLSAAIPWAGSMNDGNRMLAEQPPAGMLALDVATAPSSPPPPLSRCDPAPLLAAHRGDSDGSSLATTRPTASARTPLAPPGMARDEPTEVHVHIGRIDVTAVRDAPPPPRRRAPPPTATSLDAYFAQRSKAP